MSSAPPDSADLRDRITEVENELAAIRRDDPALVGPLLERYRPYLLAIAARELSPQFGRKVGASDLVQETLALGYEHFGTFQGTSTEQLARWLRRILLNHLTNVSKAFGAERRDVSREQSLDSHIAEAGVPSASRALVSREEWESFNSALARLPEESRRVILLRHRENLSFGEIARLLSRSEATTRRIWTRAVHQLQLELHVDESRAR